MRLFLLLLLLASPALAQDWSRVPLRVVAGQSLGPIRLGQPIPAKAYEMLGASSGRIVGATMDGGGESWRRGDLYINVKTHDGRDPQNVFQIFWTASGPRTADGIGVGSSMREVRRRYPKGHWTDAMDGECWMVPGLSFVSNSRDGKVFEMHLFR